MSIAWELSRNGISVQVLEQGQLGQEASWAGAGILPPGNPECARSVEARLRAASHVLWPRWSEQLRAVTGVDNGFLRCGGLEVLLNGNAEFLDAKVAAWQAEGVAVDPMTGSALRQLVPSLSAGIESGFSLPELCQVRNPRHLKALSRACTLAGVDIQTGTPVIDFVRDGERIAAVRTPSGDFPAARFVVASGAWSGNLMSRLKYPVPIEPIRGQIVLLNAPKLMLSRVIEVGARYVVPRADGRILIGSTEERAGFEKRTTACAMEELIGFARQVIPDLGEASVERHWAGLRPFAPGGLPRIGPVPGTSNLWLAAGHFRAGLQLSPMTAVLVREQILGQRPQDWAAGLAP